MAVRANVLRSYEELFVPGKTLTWRKGQITTPKWLQRENGYDFINITHANELEHLAKYLEAKDDRLAVRNYNTFLTTFDRAGNPMIVLSDVDDVGDSIKSAIIIVLTGALVMPVVDLVEHFCGTESVD